ncbi:S-layer family protein, partial [Maricaulis sp.]
MAGAAQAQGWSNPSVSLSLPSDGSCIAGPYANNTVTQIEAEWTAFNNDSSAGRAIQLVVWRELDGEIRSSGGVATNAPTGQLPLQQDTFSVDKDYDLVSGTDAYIALYDYWASGSVWSNTTAPFNAADLSPPVQGASGYAMIDMTTDPDCVATPEIGVTGNGTDIADGDGSPGSVDHTDFGAVAVSSGTVSRTFTITNSGSGTLTLGSNAASLSGSHAADFSITSQPATSVASGGGTTTVTVRFDPSVVGTRDATLTITNNDADESPYNFAIRGTGTGAPEIAVTGNGVNIVDGDGSPTAGDHTDFGSADISSGTVSRTFTITNSGSTTLTLGSNAASLSGAHAADFSITSQPATSVAASGGTTTVTVQFDPSVVGSRIAGLSIANDDSDESPFNFTILGMGTGAPEIAVTGNGTNIVDGDSSPSSGDHTDFGSAFISSGMVSRTFTITNSGSTTLTLGSNAASLSGGNAADFSITSQPATSVSAGGGTTSVTVRFDPSALGTRSTSLSIVSNDSDESPFNFTIQGTGTGTPEIAVTGNGVNIADGDSSPSSGDHTDFGSANPSGGTVSRTFTITNSGTDTLVLGSGAVSVSGVNATDFSVTAPPATSVAAGGGTTTFTVEFDPSITGVHSATLSIANNDADESPFDFAVRGIGEDLTAPSGYAVAFNQPSVNAANETAVSFDFGGAEVGADYNYTISSNNGGTPVSGSGTIVTATDTISGIDVSGLNDGTLTLSVTLTDGSGNTGSAATDTASKDATAPSGYSVTLGQDPVTAANETAVSFTFADGEASADYAYTISSNNGGANVTGSGTLSGATDTISGIDVSGLNDGTLTLSVTLTDPAGNTGAAATDTAEKDADAPSGYSVSFDQAAVNAGNADSVSFTFAGAEVGTDYDYTITSSHGGGSVTGSGTIATATDQIGGIDVLSLVDGTLTLSVRLTDSGGNTGSAATATVSKDVVVPSGYTVSLDQDPVTAANVNAVSFTFAGAEVGADYDYTITSSGGGGSVTGSGTIATATDQISGIDVSGLPDGTLTLSVTLTDPAGNTGSASTDTAAKDAAAPSGYSVSFDQDPIGDVDDAAISFTFASAEVGADYDYTITSSGGGGSVTGSGTIATATDRIGSIDVSGLPDGTLTLSVTLTDSGGNAGGAATDTVTKDTTAPVGFSVSFDQDPVTGASESAVSFTFAGGEVSADYSYTISSDGGGTNVTGSGTLAGATDQITGIDVSGLGDGTLTLSVTLTDGAGNASGAQTDTATKDTNLPGFSKAFAPATILVADVSTLTFTVDNTSVAVGVSAL